MGSTYWRHLARHMNLSDPQIDRIDYDYEKYGLHEKVYFFGILKIILFICRYLHGSRAVCAFVCRTLGVSFIKSLAGQIGHSAANGSPPLRHSARS